MTLELKLQLKKAQINFPNAHIAYNAENNEYFVCYFSKEYYNSLMIIHHD